MWVQCSGTREQILNVEIQFKAFLIAILFKQYAVQQVVKFGRSSFRSDYWRHLFLFLLLLTRLIDYQVCGTMHQTIERFNLVLHLTVWLLHNSFQVTWLKLELSSCRCLSRIDMSFHTLTYSMSRHLFWAVWSGSMRNPNWTSHLHPLCVHL